tara:strand:+ start:60941 stop:61969 length:1029 start_codon:yes stop_codon:yes gene_type:complete
MELHIEKPINMVFDEAAHTYTNADTGDIFTSATTLIGNYKDKFNTRYWSMYTGLKDAGIPVRHDKSELIITVNRVPENINTLYEMPLYSRLARMTRDKWQHKTDVANARGNKIHNYLEDSINESRGDKQAKHNSKINPLSVKGLKSSELVVFETKHDLDKTDLEKQYPVIYNRLLMYIENGCTIIAEKRLYISKYLIAGTIDVLVLKGKLFWIVDWKTNKDEMKFESGYYKKEEIDGVWVKSNKFIKRDDRWAIPLDKLQKCKGITYSLQLSLYAYMMELWGYTLAPNGLEIFHIRPRMKPQLIKIRYYKEDIKNMLEHHRYSKGIKNVNDTPDIPTGFGIR